MPIYEYRRPDGTTFEIVQAFSDEPLREDPETGVPVERVLHPPAVHFKGKGFYNTDYGTRRRQRENAAADGDGSEKKADAGAAAGNGAGGSGEAAKTGEGAKPATGGAASKPLAAESA